MLYNFYFDCAAILLNAMLILIVYLRRTYPTRACAMYKWLLWLNLVSASADLISAWTISFPFAVPVWVNYLVNLSYLAAHNMTAVVFLLYAIAIIRGNFGTKPERLFWQGIGSVELALILTTPWTKWLIWFDEARVYRHGPLMVVLYVCALSLLFYALFLFLRHRHAMNGFQMTTNIVFLSLVLGAVIFQFFFPYVLIESFCAAIAFLMMNVALDNPAVYFYRNSDCFNQTAFNTTMGEKIAKKADFTVIAFTFDDVLIHKKQMGDEEYEEHITETIRICHRLFGRKHVYVLANEFYAIDLVEQKEETAIELLRKNVQRTVVSGGESITLVPHFCVLRQTESMESVSDINDSIRYMLDDLYRETGDRTIENESGVIEAKHREARIVHLLHHAVRNDGFEVFFQPILENKSGKFMSAEALVRLKTDGTEFIGPEEFIPIAEKNGMILEIGEIVVDKVCRLWNEYSLSDSSLEYIEINLSMLQLMKMSAVRRLAEICSKHGVLPEHVNFEITETAGANEKDKTTINECIAFLQKGGFTFSLDDYGSGYSNITYLAEMPFKLVKIDRGILWNAMKNEKYLTVLRNTVQVIRDFGLTCVAEGVETIEMQELLSRLGCDFFQGYLYSRPLRAEDFISFLRRHESEKKN